MKITFLGGAQEIGASSLLLEVAGKRLLVDAGLRPKASGEAALPSFDRLTEPPDVVLLTHSHIDHLGALPVIHQHFPDTPVLASEPATALSKLMLLDSAYLQRLQPGEALYNRNDVQFTMGKFRPLLMGRWYHLTEAIALCMVPAGHLLGAVSLLLDTAEGRIVISGDISLTHQRTIPGFSAPAFPADVLILESTYGDSVHPPRQEEERQLIRSVTDVVQAGGVALVPSFALGRAQEVILTLRQAQQVNEIPAFPIFADGLVRAVTDVYARLRPYLSPALQEGNTHPFWQDKRVIKVKAAYRHQAMDRPGCIVASSGMLFGGPSVFYAEQLINDPKNAIFITGYTDEESPGRRLQELKSGQTLKLNGHPHKVACQVRKFGLSGHGDVEQLATLVDHFSPRATFLVHGEPDGRAGLQDHLPDRYAVKLPMNTESITIDPPIWMMGQPPYKLIEAPKGVGKSKAAQDVTPLAGEAPAKLPRLGLNHKQIVEGAVVREDIPSGFACMFCGNEKMLAIDLSRRLLTWNCYHCERSYSANLMNLKQKDISRLSEAEQEILTDLIFVSIRLQEPILTKNWRELIEKPELWRHGLAELQTETQPEAVSEPEETAESKVVSELEETIESEVVSEPEETIESEAVSEPEETTESEVVSEPEETAESEAVSEPEETAESEAVSEPEEMAESEVVSEPEETTESKAVSEPEEMAESKVVSELEETAESETVEATPE